MNESVFPFALLCFTSLFDLFFTCLVDCLMLLLKTKQLMVLTVFLVFY